MSGDIWDAWHDTLEDFIVESLRTGDRQALQGIQCLECATEWTGVAGYESILDVLWREALRAKKEAEEIRMRMTSEKSSLEGAGVLDAMDHQASQLEKGLVPYSRVLNACKRMSQANDKISHLIDLGLAQLVMPDRKSPPTWLVGLSKLWAPFLTEIEKSQDTDNSSVYASAIGKMLGFAANAGFASLRPMIEVARLADKRKDHVVTVDEVEQRVRRKPGRFIANLLERGSKRQTSIKPFIHEDGRNLTMNPALIYSVRLWETRANKRARSLGGP
jgi:hypothetical protein